MRETLINLATSQLAREKGCNLEYCTCGGFPECICGDDLYLLPQSLLAKWLREVHNIDIVINPERYSNGINYCVQAQKFDLINGDPELNFIVDGTYWFNDNHEYPTYEDAYEKGLFEGLKLIKNEDTR